MAFVFGYGSLMDCGDEPIPCHLDGYRRRWNVAMDNSVDLPGYKYYVDPATGERPPVFVTFLNVEPAAGSVVDGVAFWVSDATLTQLDDRERNYLRRDVTDLVREDFGDRVDAYVARPEARERFESAHRDGRAVISRDYYKKVLDGFATVDEPCCPVVDLRRVDLP